MAFTSSERRSTLSDRFDPRTPADPVPGGIIEEVTTTYDTNGNTAVTVPQAERWTNAAGSSDTQLTLNELLMSVQTEIEEDYNLALVPQEITFLVTGPAREVELPRLPFTSLTSVKEVQDDGTRGSDISSDFYELHGVLLKDGGPAIETYPLEVVYDGGYSNTPERLKLAIKRILTDHFDFRSDQMEQSIEEIPKGADDILRSFID